MNRERVLKDMAEQKLDGILCFVPENILFFSGCWPSTNAGIFLPLEGKPTLILSQPDRDFVPDNWKGEVAVYDTRLADDPPDVCIISYLRKVMESARLKRVGCDRSMETIAGTHIGGEAHVAGIPFYTMLEKSFSDLTLVDVTDWIEHQRMVKTSVEIEAIKKCNEIVGRALAKAKERLAAGMKETELASIIESEIQTYGVGYRGVKRARGFAFVMSGPQNTASAWGAFNISTERKLEEGDPVLIELDSQADGYWSDLSRTFVVGKPTEKQENIWRIVLDSQQRTVEALRAGMKISEVDTIARDAVAAEGFGAHFLHHVGHGVGFAFHEMPYLDPPSHVPKDRNYTLESGMVLAIEPAVYLDGWGGIRIEDNVVITPEGRAEYLSTFDRGL
jgi:Xaa-Pro aminopeptidase